MTKSRKKLAFGVMAASLALLFSSLAFTAGAQSPEPLAPESLAPAPEDYPVQYSVKFVCGNRPPDPEHEEEVKPGNYATAINIHNYTFDHHVVSFRVAPHYRATAMAAATPSVPGAVFFPAWRLRTAEIDCQLIWANFDPPEIPGTFVKGMIHLGSPVYLPVDVVYTAQTDLDPELPGPQDAGAGISIDVEHVFPFFEEVVLDR